MAEEHRQIVTSIAEREEQLAGFTQLLEVVASSTGQLEGFTGGQGVAGAAALPGQSGQAGKAGELVEACPASRNRWSRLRPHFGQGQCFSWCPWS